MNLGPADISFELWHNGVKLSKDNSIKVEWQAAAPPDPNANSVPPDFPMNSLPAAGGLRMANRMSAMSFGGGTFGRKPVQNQVAYGGYGMQGNGGWENKNGVQTHVMPLQQNGSTVY